jgi:hypothetical protein
MAWENLIREDITVSNTRAALANSPASQKS